ncbi:hypothetical protein [Minwuia sp.]|uniref:hypothetical protein n=1 Tax=Minwuia sp. TaxID=2493630 RepID=UPI003A935BBA
MISDRSAGKLIAVVTIMVCAAMASTLDATSTSNQNVKFAESGERASSEMLHMTGLSGVK